MKKKLNKAKVIKVWGIWDKEELEDRISRIKQERKDLKRAKVYYMAQEAFELEKKGLTLREIGRRLGVSHEYARLMIINYQAGYYT